MFIYTPNQILDMLANTNSFENVIFRIMFLCYWQTSILTTFAHAQTNRRATHVNALGALVIIILLLRSGVHLATKSKCSLSEGILHMVLANNFFCNMLTWKLSMCYQSKSELSFKNKSGWVGANYSNRYPFPPHRRGSFNSLRPSDAYMRQ